jgi:methylenetetrahydrofolate reductase (NADPH)
MQSQRKYPPTFSYEVFPPKTDKGVEKLDATVERLSAVSPEYVSVTYGAGGSTRERTFDTVFRLLDRGIDAAPHLACIGSHKKEIREILEIYRDKGIRRIVALRGDMPSGMGEPGDFRYANELVEFIRGETGDHFRIEVAAYPEFHPQARGAEKDLVNFRRKVEAGADAAITQYFYNADAYFRFIDSIEKLGVDIPVIPGIMPIQNYQQLARFSDACGAEIPRWIRKRLEDMEDDLDAIRAFGREVVMDLCRRLLEGGAPGLHFYSMNQSDPVLGMWQELKSLKSEV